MTTAGCRLVVLSKPPRPGACKSRLAESLGAGQAARLARAFLLDTWAGVSAWVSGHPDVDLVFAQSASPDEYPLLLPTPTVVRQGEGDLGRRMATLAAGALGQRSEVLLLGTDSPGLPDAHLAAARAALSDADIVLGPLRDGGFWCLGVRGGNPALWGNTWLDDLDWSVDGTLAQVCERAERIGLKVSLAPAWFDIDRPEDLEGLRDVLEGEPEAAPETLATLAREQAAAGHPLLSVVVTSLNENIRLDACLEALRQQEGPLEIVVADGGSTDRSAERAAASPAVTVVVTPPGRGRQFAAGARLATGSMLLFLHTDTRLPPAGARLVREHLATAAHAWGAFVTHTVADPSLPNRAGPLLRLADVRSRWTHRPYGDQAIFATRAAYDAVDGFQPLPIMEDYDLSRRLGSRARPARVPEPVTVSGRRIQQRPLRSLLLLRMIPPLFRLGVDPAFLARVYRNR